MWPLDSSMGLIWWVLWIHFLSDLYSVIWKYNYPRKIFFPSILFIIYNVNWFMGVFGEPYWDGLFSNVIQNPCLNWTFWVHFIIQNSFCSNSFQSNPISHCFHTLRFHFRFIFDYTFSNTPLISNDPDYIPVLQTPLICLFLPLGVTCVCRMLNLWVDLLLHCPFATNFWDIVLPAFGWSFTFLNSIFDALASLLVGHPFGGTKKMFL